MRLPTPLHRSVATVCLVALVACGGDDGPAGPAGPVGPSANFSLQGAWALSITDAKVGTTTCSVSGDVVTFTDANGTLSGSVTAAPGGEIRCVINGQTQTASHGGSGALASVSRTGATVSFSYNTTSGLNTMTGTIQDDNQMGGTASLRLSFSGTPTTLVGLWSATRQ